ncbi:Hypothetical Protein FCC1311_063932 [Hondaea fermentalgiana]|uniref:Proteasome assembly chaperone 4 n=1 Tax=Hondaea fermentalgiana TaxID=2315210 RepID=A0A2R5GNI0_9STRA|nr:Hypothetical Protein FCC1311_063932 [Hondaea fermentalgiana]|eukprot:GBG30173.1 Hypothetical Protein FCC1311_063932 [Hondaea fermentalgiana]
MVLAGNGARPGAAAAGDAAAAASLAQGRDDAAMSSSATLAQPQPQPGIGIERFVVQDPDEPDKRAYVMLWRLDKSFFVWTGPALAKPVLPHIVAGLVGRYDGAEPFASTVCELGGAAAQGAHGMARRLAKRNGLPNSVVHVSCALVEGDIELRRAVEAEVARRMALKPGDKSITAK